MSRSPPLLRRWSQARDGEGQVVLLSGEPGIGKSRILSTLRERLDSQGVQALRFQCSPYYVNSAFWPIIESFERTLKFAHDETPDAKLDKLEALIITHYGRPLADVRGERRHPHRCRGWMGATTPCRCSWTKIGSRPSPEVIRTAGSYCLVP
jgi:AAA ATPase domain